MRARLKPLSPGMTMSVIMRSIALLALPALLVAGGCGKTPMTLAQDPVERAAIFACFTD